MHSLVHSSRYVQTDISKRYITIETFIMTIELNVHGAEAETTATEYIQ